jgi:CDP-diacylglycerol--serine O-phosphatidyltransferase
MKQIPNIFTLLNLFFGCLAIVFTLQNGIVLANTAEGEQMMSMPEQIFLASLCIGLAGLVDFADGFLARLMRSPSDMGKQLDSLADVVSFGVAPGMIIYQFLRLSLARQENGLDASMIWLFPAFVLPCAAAWRLAKFNLDDSQAYGFRGVPTPAVGLMIASLPLIFWTRSEGWVLSLLLNKWFWYVLIALLSYLMVSNLPIMSLKFATYELKKNLPKFILLIIAILCAVLFHWMAVPIVFIAYIILSLALKNKMA